MASMHLAGDSYNHRPSDLQKLYATIDVAPSAVSALLQKLAILKGINIT